MFVHFNDGRWVLSKVQIGESFDSVTWSPNIDVK
jgi:hypothetical protein